MLADSLKRLPIFSLAAGITVAAVLLSFALGNATISSTGLSALAFLPLAAALVDAVRLVPKRRPTAEQLQDEIRLEGVSPEQAEELRDWLEDQSETLTRRAQELNARSVALQQWMQFPDTIDFYREQNGVSIESSIPPPKPGEDPLAVLDRKLFDLIEAKTHDLFDKIKQDAFRVDSEGQKVLDNDRIRTEIMGLVTDVAAIYRPGESNVLLKTNVDAVSRAVGRAALRLLVAVESLPGGLAAYDFQTIYNVVIRSVKTFGLYQSARPYLNVASSVWVAGRLASATNPVTLVAWWAASKATTYGASKLGEQVLDQQAVGLIRQLVEIVSIEVASIYSPMLRYRDVHWIYGVELVHMASELKLPPRAKLEAMNQLAALNLRDEYGRVSLMRHLAAGSTTRPSGYRPSESLVAADRAIVAERLESFVLGHVVVDPENQISQSQLDQWQTTAAERLDIQFRDQTSDVSEKQQNERAVWSLAAFALEYFEDESDRVIDHLHLTRSWNIADSKTRTEWIRRLQSDPPYLYHPPSIKPGGETCKRFLDDLVDLASGRPKPRPDQSQTGEPGASDSGADPGKSLGNDKDSGRIALSPWKGAEALRVTAYFLRSDANELMDRYHQGNVLRLLERCGQKKISPEVASAFEHLILDEPVAATAEGAPPCVRCVFPDAHLIPGNTSVHLARICDRLVCFTLERDSQSKLWMRSLHRCQREDATIQKIPGYVRSDCRVVFPDDTEVVLTGSTLRSFDSFFGGLIGQT